MGKFDSKSDNGTFLRYSKMSKAFRVYNSRTFVVEEAINVKFNDNELDKDFLGLDEFFVYLKLDDGIKEKVSSNQSSEVGVSTQHMDDP